MELVEKAPAKINLGINVVGKREDGYHELEMVMLSLELSDYIFLKPLKEKKIVLTTNRFFLPTDRRNHVYQAAEKLMEKYNIQTGVDIHIRKRTPVSAGLAGGSSDCAATLRGLNKLWGLDLSLEELAHIGSEIGSDVPYCIYGTSAYVTGRGEFVENLPSLTGFHVILVKPRKSVSTKSIFSSLDLNNLSHPDIQQLKDTVIRQDYESMLGFMGNTLEDVTMERLKEIEKIKTAMLRFGADISLMSGSGPTVFCLVKSETKAKKIYNSLKGFNREVFMTRPIEGVDFQTKLMQKS
jgi:4-diphosphocytidyl-2C-methyl-D-erythritol kinase